MGEIGPFRVAVVVTAFAGALVFYWPENYGTKATELASSSNDADDATVEERAASSDATLKCYALGLAYSLFDGAMYIFGKASMIVRIRL